MVFESIVVEILNKFLGDYVQNLDSSQLKIGIWGGDVTLKNLSLKPAALDDLDLPIKTVYGHLGSLVLKIPWKNIYTAPVQVSIDNLFLLVNPIQDVTYDKEKEEKLKQEIKQDALNKVELAKKYAKEKEDAKVEDSFVEKLTAQIIKNVQVFINNIHLRYEDRVTKPDHPFSVGVSLHTLELHTTNETCDRYILPQQESPIFYKKMSVEGLSLYWNTNSKLFTDRELVGNEILDYFLEGISKKNEIIREYKYIVGPINSEAKLQINSKPNLMNYITPKMYLSLLLEELLMNLTRAQYQDFIALVETLDRMAKGTPFRKYRPNVKEYRGHYKTWWKFAITCVLEEDVKRKFRNWDWNFIKNHRKMCKNYQRVYRNKIIQKLNQQLQNELNEIENQLDAFNIVLLRQTVENEIEREGRLISNPKNSKKGWFGGWFSRDKKEQETEEKNDLAAQFEKAMTEEEKQKLYKAIGYHESAVSEDYPLSFVATRLEFILRKLKIMIRDYEGSHEIVVLEVEFDNLFIVFQQRPAAESFSIFVQLHSLRTLGLNQNDKVPKLIKSVLPPVSEEKRIFLNILYETNPEDKCFDQRLHINLKPLKVVYDAQTVMRILNVFTPEKDIKSVKDQLQTAANSKFEAMKEKSAINLQYAIEKSVRFDLQIDIMAPYLIIPCGGFYTKNELSLVVNLGRICIHSKIREEATNIKKLLAKGQCKDEMWNQVRTQCYDQFSICLTDVQILSIRAQEKWNPMVDDLHQTSDGHILEPTCFYVDVYKCVVSDDPRLPKIKVNGNLPDITIRISEKRLMEVISLLISLPLPRAQTTEKSDELCLEEDSVSIYDSTVSLRQKLQSINSTLRKYRRPTELKCDDEIDVAHPSTMDFSNVETTFLWKKLSIHIQRDGCDTPLVEVCVSDLELNMMQRTYSIEISVKLGNIKLVQSYGNSIVPAISTPSPENNGEQYLFRCKLLMAEKESPVFQSAYQSTAVSVEIDFTKLCIIAHLEAILTTLQWINNVKNHIVHVLASCKGPQLQNAPPNMPGRRTSSVSSTISIACDVRRRRRKTKNALSAIIEDQLSTPSDRVVKVNDKTSECIELQLNVRVNSIQVCLQTACRAVASLDINGFESSVIFNKSSTRIEIFLRSISVGDLNPNTMYHKMIYVAEGDDALNMKMFFHNNEGTNDNKDFDISVELKMSSLRCVFVKEFLMDILNFVDNFRVSKEVFVGASSAAVTTCAQNVHQVYQTSTKIFLNISIKAPVIVLPLNNRSNQIFVIDFGDLSVRNVLRELPIKTVEHVPLIDEIKVHLNDLKIMRTNFERTIPEFLILKPVNCTVVVKRNLSSSWFHEIPSFDIDGSLDPVHFTIRDSDYELFMRTLNENIGSKSEEKCTLTPVVAVCTDRNATEEDCQNVHSEVTVERCDEVTSKMGVFLKFSMSVKSLEIDLYSGPVIDYEDFGLAKFTLSILYVQGSILTNNDMSVRVLLSNCSVDDTRPSKMNNKVTRYMERKTWVEMDNVNSFSCASQNDSSIDDSSTYFTDNEQIKSMIDVNYEKINGRMCVNARVFSFILILNLDHITKLQEFFMTQHADTAESSCTVDRSKHLHNLSRSTVAKKDEPLDLDSLAISCHVVIEKPDIILVESLDDIDTNAVMLNNEVNLDIQICDDGRIGISGVLQDLQLYTCCYNPAKREQTTSLILYPVTVTVKGSKPNGINLSLDIRVSDVKITISTGTIELLATIFSSMIPSPSSDEGENELKSTNYSDIWQHRIVGHDHWFLQIEEGVDIAAISSVCYTPQSRKKIEDIIVIGAPKIFVVLEAGNVEKTIPLLSLQSSLCGVTTMTPHSILFDSRVSLEVAYYNSRLALWEPVVEPILRCSSPISQSVWEPWQMKVLVQKFNRTEDTWKNEAECHPTDRSIIKNDAVSDQIAHYSRHSDLNIVMTSEERMEVTVTKSGVEAVKTVIQSFNEAANVNNCSKLSSLNNPNYLFYSLINDFGVDVVLNLLPNDPFRVMQGNVNETEDLSAPVHLILKTGDKINLIMKKKMAESDQSTNLRKSLVTELNTCSNEDKHFLRISVPIRNKDLLLPISRADTRFFPLKTKTTHCESLIESWGLVSETEIVDGGFVTTLRSVVQVFNYLEEDIRVYFKDSGKSSHEYVSLGVVSPSKCLNLPAEVVYSLSSRLYFAPSEYSISSEPFLLKNLRQDVSYSAQFRCNPENVEDKDPFFILIVGEMKQIYYENTSSYSLGSTSYNLNLRSTFIFKNYLPLAIKCQVQGSTAKHTVSPGTRISLSTIQPDNTILMVTIENYLNQTWICKQFIQSDAPVFAIWSFNSQEKKTSINLGVWFSDYQDSIIFALYCPFWMINKTELNLTYKASDDDNLIFYHPKTHHKPILFSCKERSFFGMKKACVKVEDGEWSEKLSIDAPGSSGSTVCRNKNKIYQLGVHVRLNTNTLTKQVIFSPFFSFANNCPFAIEFREEKAHDAHWHKVPSETCIPFWPHVHDDKLRTLELRIDGTREITKSFSYFTFRTYLLALTNKFGGLLVEVQVTEGGVYIAVSSFQPKFAPALIINDTECPIRLDEVDLQLKHLENEKESEQAAARCLQNKSIINSWKLQAKTEFLFNWSDNNTKAPALLINKSTKIIDLRKDGVGECPSEGNSSKRFWVSFLNGMQRTLLITCNEDVIKEIEAIGDFEHVNKDIKVSLDGIGLSVVNDFTGNELMYFCVCSSGVTWETQKKKGKRFKPLTHQLNVKLEHAYAKYHHRLKTSCEDDVDPVYEIKVEGENKVVVNFARGVVLQPQYGNLRRTYNSGIWTQICSSNRYLHIHAKVHRLQIDNPSYDCVFPVCLFPIPPPKSVAANDDAISGRVKPFAELSVVRRRNEDSLIRQFKYFKLLIQEFHVKIDIGFLNGFVKFCDADNISYEEELAQFKADEAVTFQTLCHHVTNVTNMDFYDLLHFSPLKMHLSFSLAGEDPSAGTPHQRLSILNLITQSIGVTLTDFNDIVFKLAYFERKYKFYSRPELTSELKQHYLSQFIKHLYLLVFGLDVLGNPLGLVTGLKQGVGDFFYEPFQGAIQGPSEFGEGVVLGVRSLFGHTVGGAAGAVGRITGVMGKGIAALTLDEEYQRERRLRLSQHQQSMTENSRELVLGVVEGVEGVFMKPISGAREEGVEGFVKGVGIGMVGLLMRPASGVVDFTSGTIDVLRRAATCTEEVRRCRLPRLIKENGQVVPYSEKEANGFNYLMEAEKGKYVKTDVYKFHVSMGSGSDPDKEMLLVTNNRLMYLMKGGDLFSDVIRMEWQYTWNEIREQDGIGETEDGIYIRVDANETRRSGSRFGNIFKKTDRGKVLKIPDEQVRQWLIKEIRGLVRRGRTH